MAYGTIRGGPKSTLPPVIRVYAAPPRALSDTRAAIVTVPFDFTTADELDEQLGSKLAQEFNVEIESGRSYPQEHQLSVDEFKAYFLSSRFVLGLFLSASQQAALQLAQQKIPPNGIALQPEQLSHLNLGLCKTSFNSIARSRDPTDWDSLVAFTYYIKPNYPGRSSHLCNGGFVVPMRHRGLGLGAVAGRSFLYYAPRAGYRGSLFNLVYSSNAASVRIWEQLGFQVIGTIPEAGRLKAIGGKGEEYADAQVVYGDFRKIGYADDL